MNFFISLTPSPDTFETQNIGHKVPTAISFAYVSRSGSSVLTKTTFLPADLLSNKVVYKK